MVPVAPQDHPVLRAGRGVRRALSGLRHPAAARQCAQVEVIPCEYRPTCRDCGRLVWANDSTTENTGGGIDAVACEGRLLEAVSGIREAHHIMTSSERVHSVAKAVPSEHRRLPGQVVLVMQGG